MLPILSQENVVLLWIRRHLMHNLSLVWSMAIGSGWPLFGLRRLPKEMDLKSNAGWTKLMR
jgi:hypothetical protein